MLRSRVLFPAFQLLTGLLALRVCASSNLPQDPLVSVKAQWLAGNRALHDEQFGQAVKCFDSVIQTLTRPGFPAQSKLLAAAYENRANAQYSLEHWKLAVADYNQTIRYSPGDAHAYAFRGIARKATGDYDGLIQDEQKATSLDPQYSGILDDANSTVLWRRALMGFGILGLIVIGLGAVPLVKAVVQITKAERQESN